MIVGVAKEIKSQEYRVALTPGGAAELVAGGSDVLVEASAGAGSGFADDDYRQAGARIVSREELFASAGMIVKVKEPLPGEFGLLREGQLLFTYLHLAPNRELTGLLLEKKITALGYETLEKEGGLPLLTPMSEVAGRMAPLMGVHYLQRVQGGIGILPTGVAGVRPAKAVILGAGVVGTNAARVCDGLGMDTVVLNRGAERLQKMDELFLGRVKTVALSTQAVREEVRDAAIVIGALLVPGGRTPILITREILGTMRRGAVIVDVAVDQGGCVETTVPTLHDRPVYEVDGIIHYTVANMPGAYPRTSTLALTNATFPYIRAVAGMGVAGAIKGDPSLVTALNTCGGEIVHRGLAASTGMPWRDPLTIL